MRFVSLAGPWSWVQSDLGAYLSTLAQAALTFLAILLSVGSASDSERRATRQGLAVWQGQLLARDRRCRERLQTVNGGLAHRRLIDYFDRYAVWHAFERWNSAANVADPPPARDTELYGNSLNVVLSAIDEGRQAPSKLQFDLDAPSIWLTPSMEDFLREARLVALGTPGHEQGLRLARDRLRDEVADGRSLADLESEKAQLQADLASIELEREALESLRASAPIVRRPLLALYLTILGCVVVPLALLLFQFNGHRLRDAAALSTFASLLIGGAMIVRWLRPRPDPPIPDFASPDKPNGRDRS